MNNVQFDPLICRPILFVLIIDEWNFSFYFSFIHSVVELFHWLCDAKKFQSFSEPSIVSIKSIIIMPFMYHFFVWSVCVCVDFYYLPEKNSATIKCWSNKCNRLLEARIIIETLKNFTHYLCVCVCVKIIYFKTWCLFHQKKHFYQSINRLMMLLIIL